MTTRTRRSGFSASLLVFLNPEHDPSGAGYQITQALIAVGSGGLFGIGLGQKPRLRKLFIRQKMVIKARCLTLSVTQRI